MVFVNRNVAFQLKKPFGLSLSKACATPLRQAQPERIVVERNSSAIQRITHLSILAPRHFDRLRTGFDKNETVY
ncbi:hypothetical protein [Ottowia thiooxydans]|uniref:hypothetical protein n=1 Tax=Ottowia thiooxydans TaxID=219182 RepID=UPI0033989A90